MMSPNDSFGCYANPVLPLFDAGLILIWDGQGELLAIAPRAVIVPLKMPGATPMASEVASTKAAAFSSVSNVKQSISWSMIFSARGTAQAACAGLYSSSLGLTYPRVPWATRARTRILLSSFFKVRSHTSPRLLRYMP
jgi:hypothetical protein